MTLKLKFYYVVTKICIFFPSFFPFLFRRDDLSNFAAALTPITFFSTSLSILTTADLFESKDEQMQA